MGIVGTHTSTYNEKHGTNRIKIVKYSDLDPLSLEKGKFQKFEMIVIRPKQKKEVKEFNGKKSEAWRKLMGFYYTVLDEFYPDLR